MPQTKENLAEELKDAHQRLSLMALRVSHLEHYIGLRKHKFSEANKRWRYGQIAEDVQSGQTPVEHESTFSKK